MSKKQSGGEGWSEVEMFGLLGLALIVVGFGFLMVDTVRKKKCDIPKLVLIVFIVAGWLLFLHALSLEDGVFMALNLVLIFVNVVNLYYA